MQAGLAPATAHQRLICLLVCGCATLGLFSLVARGREAQDEHKVRLAVADPRPVAQAIMMLEEKYGWVITYEDPRYVHVSEVTDVALKVRRDLDQYPPGQAPPVLIPKGGALEFTYELTPATKLPADPAQVVQTLLDAQAASNNGGRFRLESSGQFMHVIPTAINNSAGNLVEQESVLDAIISLPTEEKRGDEKLESICAAVSRATGIKVVSGTIPTNWFFRYLDQQGATNHKAREVLTDMFATMTKDSGTKLSWRLLYGPGTKGYALNIHMVSNRKASEAHAQ